MKTRLLELLACPSCCSSLSLKTSVAKDDEIIDGELTCSSCGAKFPIIHRIPRFSSSCHLTSFSLEWNIHAKTQFDSHTGTNYSEITFFNRTGFNPRQLNGKILLDAGCGSGRYLEVANKHGAEAVGVDGSLSVDSALRNLENLPNAHLVQADLSFLPFKARVFDKIYSLGAIHHSPDPEFIFNRLVRHLTNGGEIAVSVYSDEGLVKRVSNRIGEIYRRIAMQLSLSALYRICEILAYRMPIPVVLLTKPYTSPRKHSMSPTSILNFAFPFLSTIWDRDWRLLDTFDYLSPRYQSKHTYVEVISWFKRANLHDIDRLSVPVSVRGKK